MIIFYKCSFKSSHGFSIGKYDTNQNRLSFVSEKSNERDVTFPKTIEYTLSYQLGRCLLLATEENGYYFFGVYRLIEGNDDKYVNAVFYDRDNPKKILAMYNYFCTNQKDASNYLMQSIQRASEEQYAKTNLEFKVQTESINQLIHNAEASYTEITIKNSPPNFIYAFITTDKYNDYQIVLEDKFSITKKTFLCENYNTESNIIENYQLAIQRIKKSSLKIPIILGGIILLIIILLILLL